MRDSQRTGFTLVEMLAVVTIIALLIGLLVPALAQARTSARKTATAAQLKALADGCEMFHGDFGRYPRSGGMNPFEQTGGNAKVYLTGAQWLALQLVGADFQGFVDPDLKNDSQPAPDGDGVIDHQDWLDWYGTNPSRQFRRRSLYAKTEGTFLQSPEIYKQTNSRAGPLPDSLSPDKPGAGRSVWNNGKLAFFVDSFKTPVLYYAATPQAKVAFSGKDGSQRVMGKYDYSENAALTGGDGMDGYNDRQERGFDLGGGTEHRFKVLGWSVREPAKRPWGWTFAAKVYDNEAFEQSSRDGGKTGRVTPYRPDSFLLVAPGPDLLYGTKDDITNY